MIPNDTVQNVIETARIDEVVGDYVNLKKRGANLIGLCPFHNEKTPSFIVSPAKGIYKCFGCSAAGNATKFLMDHESLSFPEAIRQLANKYNIEIVEAEQTPEQRALQDKNEQYFVINQFAQQYFQETLFDHPEGKSVGMAYFKERGYRDSIIKKFGLGYAIDGFDHFSTEASKKQFNPEFLTTLGLVKEKNGKRYDFFRGRVMFTLQNLSGKPIGFAGRILGKNDRGPKYINSPETPIYVKNKFLYGLAFAKTAIKKTDRCYLVEGYTDVLSLFQEGIENVVASSGTSLTEGQIGLIRRYTENVTILYDGDAAGVNAALRGVEMILEAGLNVKIVVLPTGEDPDSYIKSVGPTAFEAYIEQEATDFIFFKTKVLLRDADNDPVKKADVIKDIVDSIARIPEPIKRQVFIQQCSGMLQIEERLLIDEMNRAIRKRLQKQTKMSDTEARQLERQQTPSRPTEQPAQKKGKNFITEEDLLRILLEYGALELEEDYTVAEQIMDELEDILLEQDQLKNVYQAYCDIFDNGQYPTVSDFVHHEDLSLSETVINLLSEPHELSPNWATKHQIFVTRKETIYKQDLKSALARFKLHRIQQMLQENRASLKICTDDAETIQLLQVNIKLTQWKKELSELLGSTIVSS